MNYELLKNISETTYINIVSIINNIKNQDLNINSSFRMAVEELLTQINNKHNFVLPGQHFYNRIINNNVFLHYMINKYKCDQKIMSCLLRIQEYGNKTAHNKSKEFDIFDVKENFTRILLLARKILIFEKNITNFDVTTKLVNDEVDSLLLQNNEDVETLKKEKFIENIKSYDDNLALLYSSFHEDINKVQEFIETFKELVSITLNYIILFSTKYNNIEDLKIGEYSELYKVYKRIDTLIEYNKIKDIDFVILDYSYVLRNIMINKFDIDILNWLINYNLHSETEELEDYNQIAKVIDEVMRKEDVLITINEVVYYIQKQKPFFYNNNVYYEIELTKAIDDRARSKLVYSKTKLPDDYAIAISLTQETVNLLVQNIDLFIVTNYKIAIRPCEIKHLIYAITGSEVSYLNKKDKFYITLMNYLMSNKCNLLDIVIANEEKYLDFKNEFNDITANISIEFIKALDKARNIILNNEWESGANVLRYLLCNLNNTVLKKQICKKEKYCINNLNIGIHSLPFDRNPFSFSLRNHKTNYKTLCKCFDVADYKDDIFVSKILEKMIENQTLFVKIDENDIENVKTIINLYNSKLRDKKDEIRIIDNYLYRAKYVDEMKNIIKVIESSTNSEFSYFYTIRCDKLKNMNIDSDKKKKILLSTFNASKMALIYGEAGSGKTELLCNYYTNIFSDLEILYVANTHTCVNNLKRRVNNKIGLSDNYNFKTIKSITQSKYYYDVDVLIIDECKSISNTEINKLFNKVKFKYCILAGDVGQINAIGLGNWFDVVKSFANQKSVFKLDENRRTENQNLIEAWNRVRNYAEDTIEYLSSNGYLDHLNSNILNSISKDEIILCLNYSGRYGINSINSYFQKKNPNKAYINNLDIYKIDDPVIFNENANDLIYENYLYNNLKGRIRDIKEDDENLYFIISVENYIPKENCNFVISSNEIENESLVRIILKKYKDNPDDSKDSEFKCPFDVTYALSIHKAQGLQYSSVKIVITPESEEIINNQIFYTAITRAVNHLKIYLTNKKQENILKILKKEEDKKDIELLKIL